MTYKNITEIEQNNIRNGGRWFSKENMRWFNCRINPEIFYGRYFITSERYDGEPRYYTIREARPDGDIDTVGEFQAFKTLAQAKKWLKLSAEKGGLK